MDACNCDMVTLVAYVPVIDLPIFLSPKIIQWHNNVLKELSAQPFRVKFDKWNVTDIKIEHIVDQESIPAVFYERYKHDHYRHHSSFLRITADLYIPVELLNCAISYEASRGRSLTTDDALIMQKKSYASEMCMVVSDIVVFSNIAKPGSLSVEKGLIFENHSILGESDSLESDFEGIVSTSEQYNWPPVNELQVRDVWNWAMRLTGFAISEPIIKGAVGRSLTAFSYLFESNAFSSGPHIMWALLGLEALYCKGNENTMAQLVEKSEVFLNTPIDFKQRFKKMYNFRSRLIHGDIDLPLPHRFDAINRDSENYENEFMENDDMAQAILLSTLQKMVTLDLNALEFSYVLKSKV